MAWLVWHRHPRARFAAYVFLTHEAVRGIHFHRPDAVAIAVLWVLLLQLPAARRFLPSLRPAEMRARWRRRLTGDRRSDAGAEPVVARRRRATRSGPATVRRAGRSSRGKIPARQSNLLPERGPSVTLARTTWRTFGSRRLP